MTNLTDLQVTSIAGPAPTEYAGATGSKAIDPGIGRASLTKSSVGSDYTIAAPGTANIGKQLSVYTTGAHAHVVTVTGLLGGNTLTFTAAIGNGFTLLAVSATAWVVIALNGITQSQVG